MPAMTVETLKTFLDSGDALALFAFSDAGPWAPSLDAPLRKALAERLKGEGFKGKEGEIASFMIPAGGKERRVLVAGLGKRKDADASCARRAAAALQKSAQKRFARLGVLPYGDGRAVCEGLRLSAYSFTKYKKQEEPDALASVALLAADAAQKRKLESGLSRSELLAEAVFFVRDLVNEAPSEKTPESIAERAKALAGGGVVVDALDKARAEKLGMGAFLGVARGSVRPPVLLHLKYAPKGAKKKVALVGKGVTFDSGGLSLKPPQHMETMKMDMAGAATVLAVFKVLPRLAPRVEVHGFAPLTYNLPAQDAVKPGDVLKAMNGKTIEVLNTDAEGRLILADALAYACRQEPDAIIDLATLTGAVLIALGSSVTGAMGNNPALLKRLKSCSEEAGEPIWELPLVKEYKENIESKIADLQNIGKVRGEAGTIIGGLFLQEFVGETPWVHFDFAGTAWTDKDTPLCPAGGTGALTATLLGYLESF